MKQIKNNQNFCDKTGRGVNICIIDSGVNVDCLSVNHVDIISKRVINNKDGPKVIDGSEKSYLKHGSEVINIVRSIAPESKIISVQIFYNNLKANLSYLVEAMRWACNQKIDIINLSLGTKQVEDVEYLEYYCNKAFKKNMVVISSAPNRNDNRLYFPSSFETVLSIGYTKTVNRHYYYKGNQNEEFLIDGSKEIKKSIASSIQLYCTSYAAARMTGIIAQIKEKYPEYGPKKKLKEFLIETSISI